MYASAAGGATLTISGSNFASLPVGAESHTLQVRLSPAEAPKSWGRQELPEVVYVDADFVDSSTIQFEAPFWVTQTPLVMEAQLLFDGLDFMDRTANFTCLPSFVINTITPNTGSVAGGTTLIVNGAGFVDGFFYQCRFGRGSQSWGGEYVRTQAEFLNSTQLSCDTPRHPLHGNENGFPGGSVFLDVVREVDNHLVNGPSFYYLAAMEVHALSPDTVPEGGGVNVSISGRNFPNTGNDILCRFGSSNSTAYMGTWISPNEIECAVPKLGLLGTHGVYVSSNGIDWVGGLQLTYEAERTVESIYPTNGRLEGGTEVVISGTGFRWNNPGTNISRRFATSGRLKCRPR